MATVCLFSEIDRKKKHNWLLDALLVFFDSSSLRFLGFFVLFFFFAAVVQAVRINSYLVLKLYL